MMMKCSQKIKVETPVTHGLTRASLRRKSQRASRGSEKQADSKNPGETRVETTKIKRGLKTSNMPPSTEVQESTLSHEIFAILRSAYFATPLFRDFPDFALSHFN